MNDLDLFTFKSILGAKNTSTNILGVHNYVQNKTETCGNIRSIRLCLTKNDALQRT